MKHVLYLTDEELEATLYLLKGSYDPEWSTPAQMSAVAKIEDIYKQTPLYRERRKAERREKSA